MPGRCQWSGFSFSITNNTGNNQVWIVEHSSKGMAERVTQFLSVMN